MTKKFFTIKSIYFKIKGRIDISNVKFKFPTDILFSDISIFAVCALQSTVSINNINNSDMLTAK